MSRGWTIGVTETEELHILPIEDIGPHLVEDCTCGPVTEPKELEEGRMGWVVIHNSWDGREEEEGL